VSILSTDHQPATSNSFIAHTKPFPFGCGLSEQEAVRVIQAERDNLDLAEAVIRSQGLDVDLWRGDLCETHTSDGQSETARKNYDAWLAARSRAGLTDDAHETTFVADPKEAQRVSRYLPCNSGACTTDNRPNIPQISRIKDAVSVQLRPAGSVHSCGSKPL
jgi:hypothetical protein